jgi:hypothetical protein
MFNSMVDSACNQINQRRYKEGLILLNNAILLDSSSSGIVNEYFRAQRNKLMNFIAEEEAAKENPPPVTPNDASNAPDSKAENSNPPASETKANENSVAENSKPVENKEKEIAPVENVETKPAEPDNKKQAEETPPATPPVEPSKPPVQDPEPVAQPAPAQPEPTPINPSVNTDENNNPAETKSFTAEEKEEFHIKGEQKVKTLEGYIKQLTDKNTSQSVVDDVTENAVALFDNEDRTVEVSSLNNPNKVKLKVRKYFQKLSMIPYENITIEWADFQYTSDFRMGVDGNYYGYIVFRQRFTAEQDQIIVYEDLTTKKIEVILKRYNKNIEGQAVANWDVFLGDISVEQTEKY